LSKNLREPTNGNEPRTSPIQSPTFVDRLAPEVVGLTYWFDPPAEVPSQTVTMRFTGRRLDRSGRPKAGDVFTIDETIDGVVAGCGPVAVTMRIRDINPGEWAVQANLLPNQESKLPKGRRQQPVTEVFPASWSWRRWRVTAGPSVPVRTRRSPFIRPPAVLLGSWAALVALGIVLALVAQALVISAENLKFDHVLTVSALSVLGGVVGAKGWYVVLHRRDGSRDGWAVQGFVSGFALITPLLLLVFRVPIGAFLDASAPGLMLGLAVGRLGCFFTGCCSGRASASRWAIWSSNRKVGLRRVPTQLMESALALSVGAIVLAAILRYGPRHGTFFIAAVATYTLIRQGLLRLREERRQSSVGAPLIAITAAVILAADLALMVLI
jgi:phosphatidylglycerol:prolipoprotein diacylglycerol transferase